MNQANLRHRINVETRGKRVSERKKTILSTLNVPVLVENKLRTSWKHATV